MSRVIAIDNSGNCIAATAVYNDPNGNPIPIGGTLPSTVDGICQTTPVPLNAAAQWWIVQKLGPNDCEVALLPLPDCATTLRTCLALGLTVDSTQLRYAHVVPRTAWLTTSGTGSVSPSTTDRVFHTIDVDGEELTLVRPLVCEPNEITITIAGAPGETITIVDSLGANIHGQGSITLTVAVATPFQGSYGDTAWLSWTGTQWILL